MGHGLLKTLLEMNLGDGKDVKERDEHCLKDNSQDGWNDSQVSTQRAGWNVT